MSENDPYAPRPKASQAVAAAHRARPDTDTATPSAPHAKVSASILIVAAVLLVGALSYGMSRTVSNTPLQITPGPSTQAFLAAPTAAPAPTSEPAALPRTIGAYAAPDGLLLGQIEETRQIIPVAHYGSGWIQADVSGSGIVWLRASDVPELALVGPDLAPVAQTGQGLSIDTSNRPNAWQPPDPAAAPAPAEPTATPAPERIEVAPASPADFTKPDIKGTCQFIGCLGQQAADLARAQACHALYWQYGDAEPESIPEPEYSAVRGCVGEGLYR